MTSATLPSPAASDLSTVELSTDFASRFVRALDRRWAYALASLMAAELALLFYLVHGLTFYFDDWDFVTHDFGGGVHSLLAAHVGNIVVFPAAAYKGMFHIFGIGSYVPYSLVVIALHLLCGGLVFVLAARRVGRPPALLATALVLFLGAAWEDLLWAFQVGYLLSVVAALATWLLLEREGRRYDALAALCLVVAVGSSSLGIPIVVGVAVEIAWMRQYSRAWLVAVPTLLYLAWYLGYGESQITAESLKNAPAYFEDLAAAAFGGLAGRSLDWGRPLAVLGAVALSLGLARPAVLTARLVGLLSATAALWIVTALARSTVSLPETSRYIYFGAILIVLVGVELLRHVRIPPRAVVVATPIVALCAVVGFGDIYAGAKGLRSISTNLKAELGALQLAEARAPATYQPDPLHAPQIKAGPYLHVVRAIGSSPADSASELQAADPGARNAADNVLFALAPPGLSAGGGRVSATSPPIVLSIEAGKVVRRGGCAVATALRHAGAKVTFSLPPSGVVLEPQKAAALVLVRRFGDELHQLTPTLAAGSPATLAAPFDAADVRWTATVISTGSLSICGRRG